MGILDNLNEPPKYIPACKVRTTLSQLDKADKEILEKALANTAWTNHTLSNALAAKEIFIDDKILKRHRTSQCSCKSVNNA
jgi:hypothetical protein